MAIPDKKVIRPPVIPSDPVQNRVTDEERAELKWGDEAPEGPTAQSSRAGGGDTRT